MSNMLKSQGKFCLGQMIENHQAGASAGRRAWPAAAWGRPTPPFARGAAAGRTTPRGARAGLSLLPLGQRPSGFLAEAPEAGR
jgi:hypothetical protein